MAAVLVGILVLPAGVAQANWTKGSYSGQTAGGGTVSFEATGRAARHFAFDRVPVACSDGSAGLASQNDSDPARVNRRSGRFKAKSDGFDTRFTSEEVLFVTSLKGKLKGTRARGRLRVYYRTTPDGALSPTGSIACDSGVVKWTLGQHLLVVRLDGRVSRSPRAAG